MSSIFCKYCKKDFSEHEDDDLVLCALEISKGEI